MSAAWATAFASKPAHTWSAAHTDLICIADPLWAGLLATAI
jgi:hypothetical protein